MNEKMKSFRMTAEEYEVIRAAAARDHRSFSGFVRAAALAAANSGAAK